MIRILPQSWSHRLLSVFRIGVAMLYMMHGTQKLFAFPLAEPRSAVDLFSLMGLAGVIETFGGALLVVGLLTTPVALLVSGEMAAAYMIAHASTSIWPILNNGELALVFFLSFLYIAVAGPGPLSLDSMIDRYRNDRMDKKQRETLTPPPSLRRPTQRRRAVAMKLDAFGRVMGDG